MRNTLHFRYPITFLLFFILLNNAPKIYAESFSINNFSQTYAKTIGDLEYDSLFDFNRNNTIDNEDLSVFIKSTPLKTLLPFLFPEKKPIGGKRKGEAASEKGASEKEENNPLDIDKDGDVDEQDVNLIKYLLTSTWLINTFANFSPLHLVINQHLPNYTPLINSLNTQAYSIIYPEYAVDFITLSLDTVQFHDNRQKEKEVLSKTNPEEKELLISPFNNSKILLSMYDVKQLIEIQALNETVKMPDTTTLVASSLKKSENILQPNEGIAQHQQSLSSNNQEKKKIIVQKGLEIISQHISVIIDKGSRKRNYDRTTNEQRNLEALRR